jgi:hypothetical protein
VQAPPRPRPYFLKGDDLERAFDDPGLAELARAGWTVAGMQTIHAEAEGGARAHRLMVLLWPPPASPTNRLDWTRILELAVLLVLVAMSVYEAVTR